MKKMIFKSTLAVVAVTASCLGAWKTYDAYGCVDNSLLMQNIEALTQGDGDTDSGGGNLIRVRNKSGKCWEAHFDIMTDDSYMACEVTWEEAARWHSCISIPIEQYNRQNAQPNRIPWTKCQSGDTGKCKDTEKQQEERPVSYIEQIK